MDEYPGIYFRAGSLGRRAALAGTRLDIWQVIDTIHNSGNSIEEASSYLNLPESRVRIAWRYYTARKAEVNRDAARQEAAAADVEASR